MCPHMWEHFTETNKTNQSPKDCFSSPHLGVFSSIFQSYSETYCVRSLSCAEVFYFGLGLASRSWGAGPGRSMGGGRGISNTFPPISLRSSSLGRNTEEKLKTLGEAMILISDIATVGELRPKWGVGTYYYCCQMIGAPVACLHREPWPLAGWSVVRSPVF